MKKNIFFLILIISFFPLFLSCSRSPIEKALSGKLKPVNENIAVSNHCQSCHLHSDFVPELHILKMQKKYKSSPVLSKSTRCLQCHDLELEFSEKIKLPKKIKSEKKKKIERKWYFFYLY